MLADEGENNVPLQELRAWRWDTSKKHSAQTISFREGFPGLGDVQLREGRGGFKGIESLLVISQTRRVSTIPY